MNLHKAYSAYREDSRLEGLSVPSHWQVLPLRYVIRSIESGVSVNALDAPADGGEVAVLKTSSVYTGEFDVRQNKTVDSEDLDRVACPVAADRMIVSRMNTPALVGAAGYSGVGVKNVYLPDRLWQVAFREANARFIHQWTRTYAYRSQVSTVTAGTSSSMHNLSQDDFKSFLLALPPLSEQAEIVDFLEREATKINSLIGKQERLIATLAERRQAVISHAVTKGLDPTAPMNDSGVSWLGLVPAHWKVIRVKRTTVLITDGAHISPETEDGVYEFVSTRDVSAEGIDFKGALKTSVRSYDYLVNNGCRPAAGDVLFSKDGTVGRTVVVEDDRPFVVASSLIIVRPDRSIVDSYFLNYLFQAASLQEQVRSFVKGAGLPRLSIANLLKIVGVTPPLSEQQEIVGFLDRETAQIDALSAKAREMIDVLKERRQALISAAVTGKIDVRGLS